MSTALTQTVFNAPYGIDLSGSRIWLRGKFAFLQGATYIAGGLLPNLASGGVLAQLQDASGQNVLIGQYTQPTVGVITAVTSVSSGTTTTIYTVNTPAAGQYVTFSGLTTATALNGQTLLVLTVNAGVSFTVASSVATQGETADTGQFAIVIGPDDMEIHSVAGSGYIYQYNKANATVQVFEVPAAASLSAVEPLQESGSSIPSGVYGDTVHFVATWVRN